MKKTLLLLTTSIAALTLTSCRIDNNEPDPILEVTPSQINYTTTAPQPQTINIVCNGDWNILSSADWIEITPKNGNGNATVSIKPQTNTDTNTRQATLSVKTRNSLTRAITITQLGETPEILLSNPEGFLAAYGDGVLDLTVTTNVKLTATIDVDWLTDLNPSAASKTLADIHKQFSAAKYSGSQPRIANVTLKQTDGQLQKVFTVTQLPSAPSDVVDLYLANVSYANTSIVNAEGAAINVNPANEVLSVKLSQPQWMKIVPTESPAAHSLTTKAAPMAYTIVLLQNKDNASRTGEIIVFGKNGLNDTVRVAQIGAQPQITASVGEIFLAADASEAKLSVMSNVGGELTVDNPSKWLTISQVGQAKKIGAAYKFEYRVRAPHNDSLQANTALLQFTAENPKYSAAVKVSQRSFGNKSMYLKEKNITLGSTSSVIVVEPVCQSGSKEYVVTIANSWIKQNPSRKELFNVEANTSLFDRETKIIFAQKYSNAKDTLYIRQVRATSDNFSRETDSMAVRAIVSQLGKYFTWYKWPSGATINDLFSLGIYTSLVNNQWRVSTIKLPSNITYTQTYPIPVELWNLSQLQVLEAKGPYVGEIPVEVGNLQRLQRLTFSYSLISGALPKEICTLPLLEEISIENLNFKSSPTPHKTVGITSVPMEWIGNKSLRQLTLTLDTQSFAEVLCGIENLESLIIMQKGMLESHSIGQSIANLRNLKTFKYYSLATSRTGAKISGDLFTLPNLSTLHIATNDKLPSQVSFANKLTWLKVSGRFTVLTDPGVRLPQNINHLDVDSYLITAVTDEMLTPNLEMLSITANSVNHISPKIAQMPMFNTLVWRGDDDDKCSIPGIMYTVPNVKKLFIRNANGPLAENIMDMKSLTHLQILDSDVEGYITDKMWNFFVEKLGAPLDDNDPTDRLVLKGNRLNSDVKESVWQSSVWTSTGSPASGAWSPNNNVVPQQAGYSIRLLK